MKRIPLRHHQLSRHHPLFVTFCRQKVTKNLFAEVLFQIERLIWKLCVTARFDFWDFVLR
jgi:hypothetical protein